MSRCSSPRGSVAGLWNTQIFNSTRRPRLLLHRLALISAPSTLDRVRLLPCCLSEESGLASCLPICAFTHGDHTSQPGEPGNLGFLGHFLPKPGWSPELRGLRVSEGTWFHPGLFWYWEVAGVSKGSVRHVPWLEKTLPLIMRIFGTRVSFFSGFNEDLYHPVYPSLSCPRDPSYRFCSSH